MRNAWLAVLLAVLVLDCGITDPNGTAVPGDEGLAHNYHKLFLNRYAETELRGSVRTVVCSLFYESSPVVRVVLYDYAFDEHGRLTRRQIDSSRYVEYRYARNGSLSSVVGYDDGNVVGTTQLIPYRGYLRVVPRTWYEDTCFFGDDPYIDSMVSDVQFGDVMRVRTFLTYTPAHQIAAHTVLYDDAIESADTMQYDGNNLKTTQVRYYREDDTLHKRWTGTWEYDHNGFVRSQRYRVEYESEIDPTPSNCTYSGYVLDAHGNWLERKAQATRPDTSSDTVCFVERRYLTYW